MNISLKFSVVNDDHSDSNCIIAEGTARERKFHGHATLWLFLLFYAHSTYMHPEFAVYLVPETPQYDGRQWYVSLTFLRARSHSNFLINLRLSI